MIERTATVQNQQGIHCRPSAVIVREAMNYPGVINAKYDGRESNLRSVMDLLILGLKQGAEITIQVSGPDETQFCGRLVELFETHFDFPPRDQDAPPLEGLTD